jgi:hypothetical protein
VKILICGNSHTVDFTVKNPGLVGWVNWLAERYTVTNLSQAGVGEYKILKQIESTNLKKYDAVIVSHSSPNRIHCQQHPVHHNSVLHRNADLIYSDVTAYNNINDCALAQKFFERYFDLDHAQDIHRLVCMEMLNHLGQCPELSQFHIVDFYKKNPLNFLPAFNIGPIAKKYNGGSDSANHLTAEGHLAMFSTIEDWIKSL